MARYYDSGNGHLWKIDPEPAPVKKKKVVPFVDDEPEENTEIMRLIEEYYENLGIPVPQEELDFAEAMFAADKIAIETPPVVPVVDENYIPPMPAYGSPEFFVWCRKTKKAREAKKAAEVAEKEAKKKAKEEKKLAKKK